MASFSSSMSNPTNNTYGAKGICQIVGLVCLTGFVIDMLVLALPPQLGNVQWRLGLAQQMSDRSIILLLGSALLIFGNFDNRRWLKRFSTGCLAVGLAFFLACIVVIADGVTLQQQAVSNISTQASQLQTQIQGAQSDPSAAGENITREDLARASQLLTTQANTLKQNAKQTVFKTGVSSIGNLIVVGLGLVSLGRYGMRSRGRQ
jgi:predicted PurR-regulated permease PerM